MSYYCQACRQGELIGPQRIERAWWPTVTAPGRGIAAIERRDGRSGSLERELEESVVAATGCGADRARLPRAPRPPWSPRPAVAPIAPDCLVRRQPGLLGLDLQAGLGIELHLRAGQLRFTDGDER